MKVVLKLIHCCLLLCLAFYATSSFGQIWQYGKNRFTIDVDGKIREFYVHIPQSYQDGSKVPLVFMLHGTSGDGEKFYDAVGWQTLSDKEGFIAVFPSSLKYRIVTDGDTVFITKWNVTPDTEFKILPPEDGADDVKFLRQIITTMTSKLSIDEKSIYLNGFSNGGQMAAKCSVEMSDILAAVCANAGTFYLDTTYTPKRKLPVLYQVGDRDYGPGNSGNPTPMSYFDELLSIPGLLYKSGRLYEIAQRYIRNFDLKSEFMIVGDSTKALVATFLPNHPGPGTGYEFKYVLVYDLAHSYPNGVNHPLDAPKLHWEWMKRFTLESVSANADFESLQNNIILHPNPATTMITISGAKFYSIYNSQGTHVLSGENDQIDVSTLPRGIYLVRSDAGIAKFIKI